MHEATSEAEPTAVCLGYFEHADNLQPLPCVCDHGLTKHCQGSLIHGLKLRPEWLLCWFAKTLHFHCRVGPLVPAMVKQPQMVQLACMAQSLEHSRQRTVQGKRPLPKAPATPVRLPMVPLDSSRQAMAEHRYVNRASRHALHVMLHPLLQTCVTSTGCTGVQHSRGVFASMPCSVFCTLIPCQQAAF